ncbi:hypothetical protein Hs30E_10570 [Lactococcus hodotermopsidis]|uniref:Double-GTPase 2 domain-containing protein n=1 Tax=Pseudolactococcus hodotermopsidis TaxID=2709157 RepID=A0A6A0BCD4_9LACT|nr:hypothetical protein [Lactococcus hodotermopsidis]GFH42506.1 hypothetical protein Hs30E_10570 [Lactococcus hodotermopsidis]
MPGHDITCPYCFTHFKDDEVHFRMETVFTEEKLDPKNESRSREEIEMDSRFSSDEIKAQIAEYERREKFMKQEDLVYEAFWQEFGGTTEKSSVSRDGKAPSVMPFQRPIFNPKNPQHAQFFGSPQRKRDVLNEHGMIYAAIDCFGKKTERRVCPHCHNPLPGAYGKYPVKFVSVIGITGAGKTVYLSQICKYIANQLSYFSITVTPTTIYAKEYIEANPVIMGKKLPIGSPPEQLMQPLCFDLMYQQDNKELYHTFVFYDIAGENCVDPEKMKGFGRFVEHADGILIVIDPEQFTEASSTAQPVKVLKTIHQVFQNKHSDEVRNLPIAICISKGDKIAQEMIQQNLDDIQPIQDNSGFYLPKFNANNYNDIHDAIKGFVQRNDNELHMRMHNLYANYNYFLFSAIGTSTKKIEGTDLDTPAGPPIPKRVMEPIAWLLLKYKFIACQGELHEPEDWTCQSSTCGGKRLRVHEFCPECYRDKRGQWECSVCGSMQTADWCENPKCKKKGKIGPGGVKKKLFGNWI